MGDKKKVPAKSSAKAQKTSARSTTKRTPAKKAVTAKATSAKTTSTKKPAAKKTSVRKKTSSILEIADNAVPMEMAAETAKPSVKRSEHWHAGLFALVVILAAYFSYQGSNSMVQEPKDNTPVVEETTETEEEETPVAVPTFNFPNDYAWLTQVVGDDLTLAPGASGEYTIQVRNSGEATWYRDETNAFRLGTLEPTDAAAPFMIASVLSEGGTKAAPNRNRVEMMQAKVAPGETATFKVAATAKDWNGNNLKPGTYRFTVGFMVEGKGSLSKRPLTWLMNVR